MFILADTEERCVLVTVYYVNVSTSVSLGDIIEIPKPVYRLMNIEWRNEVNQRTTREKYRDEPICLLHLEILNSIVTC